MARVKYGALITDISGSIGGSTFQLNHAGATARSRPQQKFFPSTLQSGSRSDLSAISTSWSTLSLLIQNDWAVYAAAHSITDRWGTVRTLTGFQYYMQSNLNLLSLGLVLLSSPPVYVAPDIVPAFVATGFSNSLHLNFYPAINFPNSDLVIYATAPTTSTRLTNRKNLYLIGGFSSPNASIFDITSMYAAAFGLTWSTFFNAASCNIIFQLMLVNRVTGVASPFTGYVFPIRNSPITNFSLLGNSFTDIGQLGTALSVINIAASESGVVIAVSNNNNHVFRSADKGLTWADLGIIGTSTGYSSVLYIGNGIFLLGSQSLGHVWRSVDMGLTFALSSTLPGCAVVRSLVKLSTGAILAGSGTPAKLFSSIDGGLTFSDLGTFFAQNTILTICELESGIVLAGTNNSGLIARSTDFGLTWASLGSMFAQTQLNKIIYCGAGICIASTGAGGLILRSTDYGLTWASIGQQFSQAYVYDLIYIGSSYIIGGTWNGAKIIKSADYGLTFTNPYSLAGSVGIRGFCLIKPNILLTGSFSLGRLLRSSV